MSDLANQVCFLNKKWLWFDPLWFHVFQVSSFASFSMIAQWCDSQTSCASHKLDLNAKLGSNVTFFKKILNPTAIPALCPITVHLSLLVLCLKSGDSNPLNWSETRLWYCRIHVCLQLFYVRLHMYWLMTFKWRWGRVLWLNVRNWIN